MTDGTVNHIPVIYDLTPFLRCVIATTKTVHSRRPHSYEWRPSIVYDTAYEELRLYYPTVALSREGIISYSATLLNSSFGTLHRLMFGLPHSSLSLLPFVVFVLFILLVCSLLYCPALYLYKHYLYKDSSIQLRRHAEQSVSAQNPHDSCSLQLPVLWCYNGLACVLAAPRCTPRGVLIVRPF